MRTRHQTTPVVPLTTITLAIAFALASTTHAQTPPTPSLGGPVEGLGQATGTTASGAAAAKPPAPKSAENPDGLETIKVTARKFEEELRAAPLAVSAYSSKMLEQAGIRDIVEIARITPGFAQQDASRTNDTPFIRGMSINSAFRDQQHASSFVDGVYVLGLARTLNFETEVERLEIIRGPQSALFGRSTFSGAINYITRMPASKFEGRVVAATGENGLNDFAASISGPVVNDALRFRLSVQSHKYTGQWTNLTDGVRVGAEDTKGAALTVQFAPINNLDITWRSSWVKFDDSPTPTVVVPSTVNNCSLGGIRRYLCGEIPIPTEIRLNLSTLNRGGGRATDQNRNYVRANWNGDGYNFISTTSVNEERFDYSLDGDGTPLRSLGGAFENRFKEEFYDTSQDLRIESDSGGKLRWLAGLYFYESDYKIWQAAPTVTVPNTNNSVNRSFYGSLSYPITKSLTASADVRYQRDEIKVFNGSGIRTLGQDSTSTLPRVIVDFKPSDQQTYYVSAAKGNRPGGFNTTAGTPPDSVNVKEQNIWSYEVGGRWSSADNRTFLAATAFKIDWSNQTTQRQLIGTTGTLIFVNANVGKTDISGLEFEAGYKPSKAWDFRGTLALVNAEYKDFLSDICFNITGVRQCAGQKLQNTPRRTASLLVGYDTPFFDNWNWFLRGDVAYRSDMPVAEVNTARNPAFTIVNLRTGIRNKSTTVTLFANNVTNEKSPSFATRFLDLNTSPNQYGYQVTLRRSREMGVRVRYDF